MSSETKKEAKPGRGHCWCGQHCRVWGPHLSELSEEPPEMLAIHLRPCNHADTSKELFSTAPAYAWRWEDSSIHSLLRPGIPRSNRTGVRSTTLSPMEASSHDPGTLAQAYTETVALRNGLKIWGNVWETAMKLSFSRRKIFFLKSLKLDIFFWEILWSHFHIHIHPHPWIQIIDLPLTANGVKGW